MNTLGAKTKIDDLNWKDKWLKKPGVVCEQCWEGQAPGSEGANTHTGRPPSYGPEPDRCRPDEVYFANTDKMRLFQPAHWTFELIATSSGEAVSALLLSHVRFHCAGTLRQVGGIIPHILLSIRGLH